MALGDHDLGRAAPHVNQGPFAADRVPARCADEAELRLFLARDDPHRSANHLACLLDESWTVFGFAHRLGRASDQVVVLVRAGFGDDLAQRSQRDARLASDRSTLCNLRAQLGHLDVVGDVDELPSDHVRDEDVHGVRADVERSQTHSNGTLESPQQWRRGHASSATQWATWTFRPTPTTAHPLSAPS